MKGKIVWLFGIVVAIAIVASAISDRIGSRAEAEYKPVPLMKFDGSTVTYYDNVAVCH
ncbi:hypothetical protein [Paenibacillus sp. HJGM_3]|uniref:hypothetical protein n=1 Tax=Paenibacillus sp. HJGM_3 TaxID=3379816 RepID=UPI00385F4EA5